MTDTNTPKDSENSAKESSSTDEATQEKLAKLSASIDKEKSTSKAASVANKTVDAKPVDKSTTSPRMNKTSHTTKNTMNTSNTTKISKTAIIALFISVIAVAGVGGIHYLHEIENKKQAEALTLQLTSLSNASEQRISQLIAEQKMVIDKQVNDALAEITNTSDTRIKQLETQINALKQNQPSDWLIHEAEYLIRIASRSIVLNKNPKAAIDTLKEADLRVKELDEFQYFNIRKLIREDIETLKAMPLLDTNETVISLLALNKQIESLTLAWVDKKEIPVEVSELTDNIADWKENLKITWDNFVDDYFTLRPINANIKPLLSPEYQQNLKENLSLKIQLAIWATTEENQEVYLQSISDIAEWIQKYFDMEKRENLIFYKNIEALKNNIISFNYTVNLLSLKEIRKYLIDKPIESIKAPLETQNSTEGIEPNTPSNTSEAISSVKEEI